MDTRTTCTIIHPEHGACTRDGKHERHASPKGSWYAPTTEALPARLRRLADEPSPPTVDSRVTAHYEGYHDGLRDAAAIAEVQVPSLPEVLALLDRVLSPRFGYLSLQLFPESPEELAQLLPGAQVTQAPDRALDLRGVDMCSRAEAIYGRLIVNACHRRPVTPEEAAALAARRQQAGVIVPELMVGLGVAGTLCAAGLLLRALWQQSGGMLAPWVAMALCALLALIGARLTRTPDRPPPIRMPMPVLPEQGAALAVTPCAAPVPTPCEARASERRQARRLRQRGHMVTELAVGLGVAGLVLIGCALMLSWSGAPR